MIDTMYHIYVNGTCIKAALGEAEFKKEIAHLRGFLELTNLDKTAKIEFERCSYQDTEEASY